MNNIKIISDGSCDLTKEIIAKNDIYVVPFYVTLDGEHYLKEEIDISVRSFYQQMVDRKDMFPKTSLPSVQDYVDAFKPFILEGKEIVCICISSKFSGSYNSAFNAKTILLEKYPDAKIVVIDAIVNTCLQGLLVLEACRMRDNNLTIVEMEENINRIKHFARIYFMVANTEYLVKGGRIGKLKGLIGNALRIKPLIVLKQGEIFSGGITFTRKKAVQKVIEMTNKYFTEKNEDKNDYNFVTGFGYDIEEGLAFNKKISEEVVGHEILNLQIGATIGAHTGPHPLGVGFIKKYDC